MLLQEYQDGDTRAVGDVNYVRQGGRWLPQGGATPETFQPVIPRQPPPQTAAQAQTDAARAENVTLSNERLRRDLAQPVRTPGQEAMDRAYGQEFVQWRTRDFADVQRNLNQLRGAMRTLETTNVTGRLLGRLPDFMVDDTVINTRETVEEVIQRNLRAVLGAQFTEQEAARLIARAYNPTLDESVNRRRLGSLITQMEQAAQAREDAARYFEEHGTLRGWTGRIWTSSDFDPMREEAGQGGQSTATDSQSRNIARAAPDERVVFWDEPTRPEGFSPEQAAAYDAFLAANPNATADQLRAFGQSIGFEINNAEAIIEARDRGGGVQPGGTAIREDPDISGARGGGSPILPLAGLGMSTEDVDAFIRGAADVVTAGGGDEIAAVGDAIFRGGSVGENLYRQRAIDAHDAQNNPYARFGGQIAGAVVLPTGIARATLRAGRNTLAAGGSREAARSAMRSAGARRLGGEGAAFGGAYGIGSSEGDIGDRLAGGAVSALIGGGAGWSLSRGLGAMLDRYRGRGANPRYADRVEASEASQAARNLDIDMLPADVGGPMTRRMTAGAAQLPFGSGPVIRRANAAQEQGQRALADIANSQGAPVRQEVLGETIQNAAQTVVDESGAAGRAIYSRARDLAHDVMPRAPRAFRNINVQLRELQATKEVEGPLIEGLSRFRNVIADEAGLKALDIDAIRRLRTAVAAEARTEGLRGTDYQRRANQVLNELREDIASQIPADAAAAFRQGDDAWIRRLRLIDDVFDNILGNGRSAEQITDALIRMGHKDSARLRDFLEAVPEEPSQIIRGSLIQEMGMPPPSQRTGNTFSFETFLTNWERMPERTRETLFRGQTRQAIEDLVLVAQRKRATNRFANTSNSGGAINVSETARALSYVSGYGTLGATMLLENLTGRLLANPVFARWLARAPSNPAQARARVDELSRIARTQPAIAAEVTGLQQALLRSLSNDVAPLAAESGGEQQ